MWQRLVAGRQVRKKGISVPGSRVPVPVTPPLKQYFSNRGPAGVQRVVAPQTPTPDARVVVLMPCGILWA